MRGPSKIAPKIKIIDPHLQSLESTEKFLYNPIHSNVLVKKAKNFCSQDGYHAVTHELHVL